MALHVLSAGAAKGLITELGGDFTAGTGIEIDAAFGAVGIIKEKFLSGDTCDVLVLTLPLIDELRKEKLLTDSGGSLGAVHTGIAVPDGNALPDISTVSALRASLMASNGIYMPDGHSSTAGSHFKMVLRELGIEHEAAPRLRSFQTGEGAMRHLAAAPEENALGCTQTTEIKFTKGLRLVGPLPKQYDLSTLYVAAVCALSANQDAALRFIELLAGDASRDLRIRSGFECAS